MTPTKKKDPPHKRESVQSATQSRNPIDVAIDPVICSNSKKQLDRQYQIGIASAFRFLLFQADISRQLISIMNHPDSFY